MISDVNDIPIDTVDAANDSVSGTKLNVSTNACLIVGLFVFLTM